MIVKITSMALALGLILFQLTIHGSSPEVYLGLDELLACGLIPFFVVLAVFDFKHFVYFLKHVSFQKQKIPSDQLVLHRDFYRFYSDSTIGVAVFVHLATLIAFLQNMSDPSSIGVMMAASLMPLFIAVIITQFFLNPLTKNLELTDGFPAKSLSTLPSLLIAVAVCSFTCSSYLFQSAIY